MCHSHTVTQSHSHTVTQSHSVRDYDPGLGWPVGWPAAGLTPSSLLPPQAEPPPHQGQSEPPPTSPRQLFIILLEHYWLLYVETWPWQSSHWVLTQVFQPRSFPSLRCQIPVLDLSWPGLGCSGVSVPRWLSEPGQWLCLPRVVSSSHYQDGAPYRWPQGYDRHLRRHWQTGWRSSQDWGSTKLQEGTLGLQGVGGVRYVISHSPAVPCQSSALLVM